MFTYREFIYNVSKKKTERIPSDRAAQASHRERAERPYPGGGSGSC